jgi:hypothetical protein
MLRRALVLSILCLLGCGKEAGRVAFDGPGSKKSTVPLAAKEVAFWTDIDAEWDGSASAQYEVEFLQNGETIGSTTCDPLARASVRLSWVETNIGDHHTRRGQAKLGCALTIPTAGDTTVRAKLRASNLTVRKADLVLKQ